MMTSFVGNCVRTVLWSAVVPGGVTAAVPILIFRLNQHQLWNPGPWHWLGLLPVLAAICLYLWSAWSFVAIGGGTPNPLEPPRNLVARGPYALTRNPMYLACFLAVLGEEWFTASDWLARYLAGGVVLVWAWVLVWEEPQMRRRHADAYRAYCRQVPRWFGLPRTSGAPT
jgi:protein-S-isoprenylcysteine O-methyltransferase Ste14